MGLYPLHGSPYSIDISTRTFGQGIQTYGDPESVSVFPYPAVPNAWFINGSINSFITVTQIELISPQGGILAPIPAESEYSLRIPSPGSNNEIPFYLLLHQKAFATWVSHPIYDPPRSQSDFSVPRAPVFKVSARASPYVWGESLIFAGALSSGDSVFFGGEYQNFEIYDYPIFHYKIENMNWANGGTATLAVPGFTALIIIPGSTDPEEYVIPPEWWDWDPDRRRRSAWVAGAGARFSGALSGVIGR